MNRKLLIAVVSALVICIIVVFVLFSDRTPPEAPILVEPVYGHVVARIPNINFLAFTWYEPELGCTYDCQIATGDQFTNVVLEKTRLPPASFFVGETETLAAGTYYWRVRAIDKAGNVGPWSEVWMFVVISTS